MSRKRYRKIWEIANGPIPKDNLGRTYEIHHIDGDETNDVLSNLQALSMQEHYDIHYAQGDYGSCWAISLRMRQTHEEYADLLKLAVSKRVGVPRLDMVGAKNPMRNPETVNKIKEALTGQIRNDEQRKNCSIAAKKQRMTKIKCDHCNKLASSNNYARWHGEKCLKNPQALPSNRQTNFSKNNPTLIKVTCEHCGAIVGMGNYVQWHGENCKEIKYVVR